MLSELTWSLHGIGMFVLSSFSSLANRWQLRPALLGSTACLPRLHVDIVQYSINALLLFLLVPTASHVPAIVPSGGHGWLAAGAASHLLTGFFASDWSLCHLRGCHV